MSRSTFRALYLASIILGIGSSFADDFFSELIPEELRDVADIHASQFWISDTWFLLMGAAWLLGTLISTIGFWFFYRWSRALSLVCTLFALALGFSSPPLLVSGVASSLTIASAMLWGAVLVASFTKPISDLFETTRNTGHSD